MGRARQYFSLRAWRQGTKPMFSRAKGRRLSCRVCGYEGGHDGRAVKTRQSFRLLVRDGLCVV
jgi:hypothetical protein